MAESQNVQIPMTLLKKVIWFFELLNVSDVELNNRLNYEDILTELRKKQHSINLRCAYTKMITTKDDAKRSVAGAAYIKLKKELFNE